MLGALLNDLFHSLHATGLIDLLEQVHGANTQRAMVPFVQYILLYGLKSLFVTASINALLRLLFREEALMHLLGLSAQVERIYPTINRWIQIWMVAMTRNAAKQAARPSQRTIKRRYLFETGQQGYSARKRGTLVFMGRPRGLLAFRPRFVIWAQMPGVRSC
jgi:hypothetical protein